MIIHGLGSHKHDKGPGSRVPPAGPHVSGLGCRVPPMRCFPGLSKSPKSRVSAKVPGPRSLFSDMSHEPYLVFITQFSFRSNDFTMIIWDREQWLIQKLVRYLRWSILRKF